MLMLVCPAAVSLSVTMSDWLNVVAVAPGSNHVGVVPTSQVPSDKPPFKPFHVRICTGGGPPVRTKSTAPPETLREPVNGGEVLGSVPRVKFIAPFTVVAAMRWYVLG